MRTIYLNNNLKVLISTIEYTDTLEISFYWNKSAEHLPFSREIKEIGLDGSTIYKNYLILNLIKYLELANPDRELIISKLERYIKMDDKELQQYSGCSYSRDYRHLLKHGLYKIKTRNIHLALIELITILWI